MFGFKKKDKCKKYAEIEINYLNRLRELKQIKEELKSQKMLYSDLEYMNSVFAVSGGKRDYLIDKLVNVIKELMYHGMLHFDDFDKMVSSGQYSLYPIIIDIKNYLNGYCEYKEHEENIDTKIIEIEEEICKIKERLGI